MSQWDQFPLADSKGVWDQFPLVESSKEEAPITAGGALKATGAGVAKGAIGMAGMPGDLRELAATGVSQLTGAAPETISKYLRHVPLMGGPTSQQITGAVKGVTGDFYEPQNRAERYAEKIGEFAPSALFPGGVGTRVAQTVIPAVASQTAAEMGGGPLSQAAAAIAGGMGVAKAGNIAQRLTAGELPSLEKGAAGGLPEVTKDQYTNITKLAAQVPTTKGHRELIANAIEDHLDPQNFRRESAPKTFEVLDEIRNGGKVKPMTAQPGQRASEAIQRQIQGDAADLLTARQKLRNIGGKEYEAARQAEDVVNSALEAYIPGVGKRLEVADQNYNALKVAKMLGERFNKAELQAAGANSGLNLGNRLRQQATQVATNPRLTRFMKPEDVAALEAMDRGTPLQNTTRWVGNYLGGGGGWGALGASALFGHLVGGPLGVLAPIAGGLALKRGYNRSIANEAQRIADMIVARSPEAQRRGVRYVPRMTIAQSARRALPRAVPGGVAPFQ